MNTDSRYGNPRSKKKKWTIVHHGPLRFDVKVWMFSMDFFFFFDVEWSLPVFTLALLSLCDITIQFVPALPRTWKQLPHTSVRVVEVRTLENLAEILIRGQRRGGQGGISTKNEISVMFCTSNWVYFVRVVGKIYHHFKVFFFWTF